MNFIANLSNFVIKLLSLYSNILNILYIINYFNVNYFSGLYVFYNFS